MNAAAAKRKNPWAVIRIPRALYERILAGQGKTQHETIARAMDAVEDAKGARRIRELRAELETVKLELEMLQAKMEGRVSTRPLTPAAERTVPLFPPKDGGVRVVATTGRELLAMMPNATREEIAQRALSAVRPDRPWTAKMMDAGLPSPIATVPRSPGPSKGRTK